MTGLRTALPRLLPVGTMTLVATGCVEPLTPASFVSREDPSLPLQSVSLPSRDELVSQWQLPADNPWAPYEKFTLPSFLDQARGVGALPDIGGLADVQAARRAAAFASDAGLLPGTLFVIDLRGAASVAFGSELSHRSGQSVAVVPTFNNWPADDELVPAEETLAAMIAMPPRLMDAAAPAAVPVFLLDAWRLAYKDDEIDDSIVDNRYMLSASDLPSVEVLASQRIERVIYVVEDRHAVAREEDDLNDLFQAYDDAGIEIDIVDLAWFGGEVFPAGPQMWVRLEACHLTVYPRVTVIHDGRFYARARGGFGGAHARPFVVGHPSVAGHGIGGG
jgi:hypothetical protein